MKSFTPFFLIAICVGAYFIFIAPTYSDVQSLTTERDSYNQVLQQAKSVVSKRNQDLASYNSISPDDLSRLSMIAPLTFNLTTFASHLSTIAGKYGVAIINVQSFDQNLNNNQVVAPVTGLYQTKNVKFSVRGQYTQLISFMKDLENGLYLVDVTDLSVKKIPNDKTGASYEFDVGINTYSLK